MEDCYEEKHHYIIKFEEKKIYKLCDCCGKIKLERRIDGLSESALEKIIKEFFEDE